MRTATRRASTAFNYAKTAQAFIDASENGLQPGDRKPVIVPLQKEAI